MRVGRSIAPPGENSYCSREMLDCTVYYHRQSARHNALNDGLAVRITFTRLFLQFLQPLRDFV